MNTKLKPGYLLYRSKAFAQHTAVYIGNNQVFHNSPSAGIEIVSYAEYAEGKQVKVIATDMNNREMLVERLQSIMNEGSSYQLLGNNCEHIANLLINGRKYSPQIQATVFGVLIGALISRATKQDNPLLMILGGGLLGCLLSNLSRRYDGVIEPV